MMLTAQILLQPTASQQTQLFDTLQQVNRLKTRIGRRTVKTGIHKKYDMQADVYRHLREETKLPAQFIIRAIDDVAASIKTQKTVKGRNGVVAPRFRKYSAISYDYQIVRYDPKRDEINLRVADQRIGMPFQMADEDRHLLESKFRQSKLVHKQGRFFLHVSYEKPEQSIIEPEGFLGVDMGITNIAVLSNGTTFTAEHLNNVRSRYQSTRARCQKKGTKSALRVLRNQSGKEKRFVKDTNHCLSKQIVVEAKRTGSVIVLEDLTGIRENKKVNKTLRAMLGSWAFHDLRQKIEYKAALAGIQVIVVPSPYTSQTCSVCGYSCRENRKRQDKFVCRSCGFVEHADLNAAKIIAVWGAVNHPNGSLGQVFACPLIDRSKPPGLSWG